MARNCVAGGGECIQKGSSWGLSFFRFLGAEFFRFLGAEFFQEKTISSGDIPNAEDAAL